MTSTTRSCCRSLMESPTDQQCHSPGPTPSPASTTNLAVDGAEVGGVDDAGGAGFQPAVPLQMEGMKGRSQADDVESDLFA